MTTWMKLSPEERLSQLRSTLNYRTSVVGKYRPLFKYPKRAADFLPIEVSGGIGDVLMAIPVVESLQEKVGNVVVYTRYLDIWMALSKIPARRISDFPGYDLWLHLNHLPIFKMYDNFKQFNSNRIDQLYLEWKVRMDFEKWLTLADYHPLLDHEVGNRAVAMGLNRRSLCFHVLGLKFQEKKITDLLPFHHDQNYITIHDGFDSTHTFSHRATKNWSLENWTRFVREFKHAYPDIDVIQLGGSKSRHIEGTINLSKQLSFLDSMRVLAGSRVHVDGESGLVHAARMVGTKSIVMFGPTNLKYFHYPENDSVQSKATCPGNCWWLTREWNEKCPIGFDTPKCMDDISPDFILAAVTKTLTA